MKSILLRAKDWFANPNKFSLVMVHFIWSISDGPFHKVRRGWIISYVFHTIKDVSNEIIKLPSSDLDGIWHAYIGHHPDYDCIDCQQIRLLDRTIFSIF